VKVINFVTPWPVTDTVFGVPEYLSPEQAEGRLVDQRSNTYSLGAIMNLLLTGAPPFSGPTPQAVLEQVLRAEVTPPSRRKADLGPEIDRVVMKALDKSSSRRPLTMRQFLNDVAALGTQPSGAATFGAGARPAGPALAKTMMFAGGAPEVQRLVAEATAARAEANGSAAAPAVVYAAAPAVAVAAPAPAPVPPSVIVSDSLVTPPPPVVAPDPHRTPPPNRSHGAAVAATMIAMPAATPAPIPGSSRGAGNGAQAHAHAAAAAAAPAGDDRKGGAAGGGTGNFRETLWFKKGDVDQMVADAKAKAAGRGKPDGAPEDAKPLEDRYVDDGSVTVEDRKNFSLRSGGTSSSLPTVRGAVPGDRMSDAEMLNEMGGGRKVAIIVIAVAVVAAIVAVLFVVLKGKGGEKSEAPVPAVTKTAEVTPPPAPAPPKAVPTATAPEAAPPAAGADDGAKDAVAAKESAATPKAKAAGKKKSAGKRAKKRH
jgi:hypothetical protein